MIAQYDFITVEFPIGFSMKIEAVFHHGIFEDENGWFNMFLN